MARIRITIVDDQRGPRVKFEGLPAPGRELKSLTAAEALAYGFVHTLEDEIAKYERATGRQVIRPARAEEAKP